MTLLITIFAAIITTIVWYNRGLDNNMKLGNLCLMYWGAFIMWFVDAVFEYVKIQSEYFTPSLTDMLNDTYLGFSVVALGLLIWLIILFVKDPEGIVRNALLKKR